MTSKNMNIFEDSSSDFAPNLNRFTMTFSNPAYEEEFLKYKFERKNILIIIAISIYFSMIIMGNAYINIPLKVLDDLKPSPYKLLDLLSAIGWYLSLLIELIIFFISKVSILRGFFFTTIPMLSIIYRSYDFSADIYKTSTPIVIPIGIIFSLLAIVYAFIYAKNWICGSIQILIMLGILEIYIIIYQWNWMSNKPILMVVGLISPISVILTLNYFEYFQRKAIYMKIEAELQKKYLRDTLNKIPEPILITKNGDLIYQNNAFQNIKVDENIDSLSNCEMNPQISPHFGSCSFSNEIQIKANEDLPLEKLDKIIHKEQNLNFKEAIRNNREMDSEPFIITKSNSMIQYFEISSVIHRREFESSILYLLKDVTKIHQIEELQNKEKFLRVYFASLTHDFRTPIGIIQGNTDILLRTPQTSECKAYLINIHNASSIILLIVQDILDYSQMKSGTFHISEEEFNIYKEIQMIIDLFKEKYDSKGLFLKLNFNSPMPPNATNDPNRIKQILMNLLSNAFKFTPSGGVEVNVTYSNNFYFISVSDTGIGMETSEEEKLFTEFGRLDRHQEINKMGIGLGLYICKNLVNKLGGTISVNSRLNEGTTFQFSFKRILHQNNQHISLNGNESQEESKEVNNGLSNLSHLSKEDCDTDRPLIGNINIKTFHDTVKKDCECTQLLIVEDEPSLRKVIKKFAEMNSIKYDECENGAIALEKVKLRLTSLCCPTYKIIFTDLNMPIMDGLTSSKLIKEELKKYPNYNTKIILVSGLSSEEEENIKKSKENPFTEIEPKPLSYATFLKLVQDL